MAKFILLHAVPTGDPIILHREEIRLVKKSETFEGASAITGMLYDSTIPAPFIHVAETPEKIFEMLQS